MKKRIHLKTIVLMCLISSITLNAQWYKVDSKTTENIYDIFFVDKKVGYCIAGDGILKSTDSGDSWNKIYKSTKGINFTYIVAFENTVIAFAFEEAKGINYKYTSVDNGSAWENETINYSPKFVQSSNNNVFFQDTNDSWKLKKLSNSIITTILDDDATIYGVNKNEIVYVDGSLDSIYKSVNSGLTWNLLPSFPRIYNTTAESRVKSFNDTIIYRNVYPNYINVSYDNGESWVQKDGGDPWVGTIVNSSTLYSADSNVYTGNLEGVWVLQANLAEEWITKLYFYDNNLGFAIGENGIIYKTNNGGSLRISENKKLEKKIKVFPIPSKKLIKLEIPSDIIISSLQIYDIQGKLIKTFKNSKRKLKVNNLNAGNYLLKIKTDKGTFTKRIIIE